MPSGSGCCPPDSLPLAGDGPFRSWLALLWYSLNPLFCEQAQQCLRLGFFVGKFSLCIFSFSLSLAIPQFRLLSHVSSFRLPSGISGLILTLSSSARSSPFSPRLLVADASVWGASLLGVALRHVICGVYFTSFFFLSVMLPSKIPKLPTDLPVRGFPGVWKLLLF